MIPRRCRRTARTADSIASARPTRRALRRAGLRTHDLTGVVHDPLRDRFRLSRDPAVDYGLFAAHD